MAEALGAAASIISIGSLAVQIVNSIQTMIEYWSSIQDAPRNIEFLLEEVRLLGSHLSDFRGDTEGIPDFTRGVASEALVYCEHAADDIHCLAMDLKAPARKAKKGWFSWSAVKIASSEKKLNRYVNRLERAKSMLSLAQQRCIQSQIATLESLQRHNLTLGNELLTIVSRSSLATTLATSECDSKTLQSWPLKPTAGGKKGQTPNYWADHDASSNLLRGTPLIGLKTPGKTDVKAETARNEEIYIRRNQRWLVWRGYGTLAKNSYGGWQYSFRSYNIFTLNDPIYLACVSNDLSMVQRLCSQGKASPFDITQDGWTLLHVTAAFAYPKLCNWLICQGVDGNVGGGLKVMEKNEFGITSIFRAGTTPLQAAANCSGREARKEVTDMMLSLMIPNHDYLNLSINIKDRSEDVMDTLRVLIEKGKGDPMISNTVGDTALHLHTGSIGQFKYLLQEESFTVDQILTNYDTIAERHARGFWPDGPEHARLAFELETRTKMSSRPQQLLPTSSKLLLLHESASHLQYYINKGNAFNSCLELIQSLVENGVNVHGVYYRDSRYGRTPLAQIPSIIEEFPGIGQEELKMASQRLVPVFHAWLSTLRRAKVNLSKYLEEEERLASQNYDKGLWETYEFDESLEWRTEWRFSYVRDDKRSDQEFIYATYHFRQKPEAYECLQEDEIPAAWAEGNHAKFAD